MFNPVIIAALVVQGIISSVNRTAGCVASFLITTGILVWGLSVFSDGGVITLFGIPLTRDIFLFACVIWYGYDVYDLFRGGKSEEMEEYEEEDEDISKAA